MALTLGSRGLALGLRRLVIEGVVSSGAVRVSCRSILSPENRFPRPFMFFSLCKPPPAFPSSGLRERPILRTRCGIGPGLSAGHASWMGVPLGVRGREPWKERPEATGLAPTLLPTQLFLRALVSPPVHRRIELAQGSEGEGALVEATAHSGRDPGLGVQAWV